MRWASRHRQVWPWPTADGGAVAGACAAVAGDDDGCVAGACVADCAGEPPERGQPMSGAWDRFVSYRFYAL